MTHEHNTPGNVRYADVKRQYLAEIGSITHRLKRIRKIDPPMDRFEVMYEDHIRFNKGEDWILIE